MKAQSRVNPSGDNSTRTTLLSGNSRSGGPLNPTTCSTLGVGQNSALSVMAVVILSAR